MQFLTNTNYPIVQQRKYAFIISGIIILAGILSLIVKGGPRYSIDFTGGTEIVLHFQQQVEEADVRDALSQLNLVSTEIKAIIDHDGSENIAMKFSAEESNDNMAKQVQETLRSTFSGNDFEVLSIDKVGPKIGNELRTQAFWAIVVSIFFIVLYITIRFEFKFAIGAIVALIHDVLVTLGLFSIMNYEISLAVIGAFLTIIGYSLNDTIVVYDRIRENVKKLANVPNYEETVNRSINQSLSRTVITSLTTLVVVVILLLMGGDVIHTFAFAMTVGVIVGTYSSAYIAAPVVIEWQIRSHQKELMRKKK